MNLLLERTSPVLVVGEHVETGASRREQHPVAGKRAIARFADGFRHRGGARRGADAVELLLDLGRRLADEHGVAETTPRGPRENREVLPLALAAENDDG